MSDTTASFLSRNLRVRESPSEGVSFAPEMGLDQAFYREAGIPPPVGPGEAGGLLYPYNPTNEERKK